MAYPIEMQHIWKSYLKGSGAYRYQTLRDTLAAGAAHLVGKKLREEPRQLFWALKDISFNSVEGETLGLIGRNGAGKTTMLKIIARITRPSQGQGIIRGRVGSLLEVGTGFHPELTGRENIILNGAILGMKRPEVLAKFDQIVDFAGSSEFIDTPMKRYSSGMAMRLAFSVAAHLEPEVLLVDEVLAVGDNEFQKRCLNRIIEIAAEGRTVVFVSHNMGTIERVCSRAILLNDGELIADGPAQDVVHAYHSSAIPQGVPEGDIRIEELESPRFFRWAVDSEGALGSYTIVSGAGCTMSFGVAVPEPIPDAFFGIAIYTAENVLAMALSSFDLQSEVVELEAGIHEARFHIPSLPLGRGQYHALISLVRFDQGPIATWNARPGLEVVRRRESTQIPPPWEGILVVPASFSVGPGSLQAPGSGPAPST